jgi:hypothetical protein
VLLALLLIIEMNLFLLDRRRPSSRSMGPAGARLNVDHTEIGT